MSAQQEKPSGQPYTNSTTSSPDNDNNTPQPLQEDMADNKVDEVANNDGSIIETLDTAFHGQPGMIKEHSPAGSNRADYYESRSDGKTDSEEEVDAMKDEQPE